MIEIICECGANASVSETQINKPARCTACRTALLCISAERLGEGAGAADFDAGFALRASPNGAKASLFLGGCNIITIGSQKGTGLCLTAGGVSPVHCRLVRLDFGPSRWAVEAIPQAAPTRVNGKNVARHELQSGDRLRIGPYELEYLVAAPVEVVPFAAAPTVGFHPSAAAKSAPGHFCPSCSLELGPAARICIPCGIYVKSGRPLLIAKGVDESRMTESARAVIYAVSWLVPLTPLPIPLASEAYGKFKPYAIWTIAALTVLCSVIFFFAVANDPRTSMRGYMLWPPNPDMDAAMRHLSAEGGRSQHQAIVQLLAGEMGEFHWYQVFTCALLHDPSSIVGFALHLGGNLLFLLVFGSRVNAIIGNIATAILYPILALAASTIYLLTLPAGHLGAMLGASGAINGLAGMYLILFPAHRIYCAMWIRFGIFGMGCKIFALRGFWMLIIYFAYDALMVAIGFRSGTAHWAHIGGFLSGVVLGLGLLASRQFDCRNGDLLSVMLGKYAWPLIGKPSRAGAAQLAAR